MGHLLPIAFVVLLLTVSLTVGCATPHVQIRTQPDVADKDLGSYATIKKLDDDGLRNIVGNCCIERYDEFLLGFVEFDDQGKFWNKDLQLTALDKIGDDPAIQASGATILVFVHGWKHNADVCDSNVEAFRDVLLELSGIEGQRVAHKKQTGASRPERKVIGVYVGWRGLSQKWEPFKELSFWARKNTAHRIGRGDMDELLVHLDSLKTKLSPGNIQTRLVIIGHSFGGALVYSAVDNILKERTLHDLQAVPSTAGTTNPPPLITAAFGDLIVLVNPAFEALLYSGLHEATAGVTAYNPAQTTVLMTVGAQNDLATGLAFPIGESIPAVFQCFKPNSNERHLHCTALGHCEEYFTDLVSGRAESPTTRQRAPSPKPGKRPQFTEWKAEDLAINKTAAKPSAQQTWLDYVPAAENRRWALEPYPPTAHRPPNSPFLVVTATKDVIDGHTGIYQGVFIDFLRDFLIAQDLLKEHFSEAPP
jgi:hypothetical protein